MYIRRELKNREEDNDVLHLESTALFGDSDRFGSKEPSMKYSRGTSSLNVYGLHRTTINLKLI